MSSLVRFMGFFSLFLSFLALSQDYQFRLQGTYNLNSSALNQTPLAFNLDWNESDNAINGVYSDNYFPGRTPVVGTANIQGRSMHVTLPQLSQIVRSLDFLTGQSGKINGNVPLSVTVRDADGNTINVANISAVMSAKNAESSCTLGFGALSGFCGIYSGRVSEMTDGLNRCNLNSEGSMKMELSPNTEVNLYINFVNTLVGIPRLGLGSIPISPLTSTISLTSRHCGPVPSTNLLSTNCQTFTLNGSFRTNGNDRFFEGTYLIMDIQNSESCSYNLSFTRETPY